MRLTGEAALKHVNSFNASPAYTSLFNKEAAAKIAESSDPIREIEQENRRLELLAEAALEHQLKYSILADTEEDEKECARIVEELAQSHLS